MEFGLIAQVFFNIKRFGAKCDGRILTGGTATSGQANPSFTGAGFTSADIGKVLEVNKLSTGESYTGIILSVTNSTTVVLDTASTFTGSSGVFAYLGTDDTVAWQTTLQAAVDAGGGTVYYPNGISIVNGAFINSIYGGANPNCQVVIPQVAPFSTGGLPVSIKIMGESAPSFLDSGLQDLGCHLWGKGSIIKSTRKGAGTSPSVFGAVGQLDSFGAFNMVDVFFENTWIRTSPGGYTGGIQIGLSYNTCFRNVRVDTTLTGAATKAPQAGVYGIESGLTNGGTYYRYENVLVSGYKNAYLIGEHTTGNNMQAFCCENNLVVQGGSHHLIDIQRLCTYWGKNDIVAEGLASGYANVLITLSREFRQNGSWYDSVYGVVDPNNVLRGKVRYHSVTSSVGADQSTWAKSGGTNANFSTKSIYEA